MEDNLRINLLDEIAKSSGYDIALMTTFNFDVSFFERAVLNQLNAQNINKVTVFVDSKELSKSISVLSSCAIGRRYMVSPIRINGAFHPKLILLLGEDKAKLFIGSANITTPGMTTNNEAFNVIEYSTKKTDYIDVINAAIDFFLDINRISYQLDDIIIEEVKGLSYYHRTNANGEIKLIHNLNYSLFDQITELIKTPVKEIRVAVPYYDNSLSALNDIVSAFPEAEILLYLQNGKSSFSKKAFADSKLHLRTLVYEGFKDNSSNGQNNFYHGKVFLFKTKTAEYMIYGSSNCTQAALINTHEHSGNIECDIVEIGEPNDFNYYFEAFDAHETKKFETQPLNYETDQKTNFYYKYGEIKDDAILLHIGYKYKQKTEVFLNGEKLSDDVLGDELVVAIPKEMAQDLPEVFEITLLDNDKYVTLRCWTYCPEIINTFRQKEFDKYSLESFDYDSEGEKYMQDRINYLNAETMCLPDIQEHYRTVALLNQIRQEQEENDKDDEDFIVDIEILDEYKRTYRQINMVDSIRNVFYKRLIHDSRSIFSYGGTAEKNKKENEQQQHYPRGATSEEKRFERFIKTRIKGMINKEYIEVITPEHFLGLVAVVLDIFSKYQDIELFDADYVIETRSKLFVSLLRREAWDGVSEDTKDSILKYCFYILMDNYAYSFGLDSMDEKENLRSINKELLMAMERRFSIRSNYMEIICNMMGLTPEDMHSNSTSSFYNYIENLFGYKNYELLLQYFGTLYESVDVKLLDGKLKITGQTDSIVNELRPNQSMLQEIRNFSRVVSPVKSVSIKITPLPTEKNNSKIVEVEHVVSLLLHNWRCTVVYADGTRLSEKPQFISI